MSLLDRTVEFAGALRAAGIPVSTAETVDSMRAFGKVDIVQREHLRAAFAATVCKRPRRPVTPSSFPDRNGEPSSSTRKNVLWCGCR